MNIMKLMLPVVAIALVTLSCSNQSAESSAAPAADSQAAAAPGEVKGFQEYPIGDDQEAEGMNIAAVYFQPVPMEPHGMGLAPENADIHIEADISATADNQTGFGVGDWIPFLTVKYEIVKTDDGKKLEGTFMPMSASDGPHYGNNIKLFGAGTYDVKFIIESPEKQGYLLHTDPETGVPGHFWKEPVEVSWTFDYIPRQW